MKPTEFSGHQPQPGTVSGDLFEQAEILTEEKANAFLDWKTAKAALENMEGLKHFLFKAEEKRSVAEIEAKIDADPEHFKAVVEEAKKQAAYERLADKLMTIRQMISFRGY